MKNIGGGKMVGLLCDMKKYFIGLLATINYSKFQKF